MQNKQCDKEIRILHVLGGLKRGGAESFVMNLYRSVDREKIQFDFVIHTKDHGDFYDEIIALGGNVYHCPRYVGHNHFSYKRWWRKFLKNHPEYRVVHSHVRSTAAIYLKMAKKMGRVTISHSHSTSSGKGIASIAKNVMQYPIRHIADYLFACSLESGIWLFGKKAVHSERFKVLKNVIDLDKCSFNPAIRAQYREEMNLEDKTVFIHVGRLHPAKNHSFLLSLFKEVQKDNPKALLLIVGDGELKSEIESLISELDLDACVEMLGSRGDVDNLLQVADCFLFPSLWEGVPLTVIEAQAAGLPCFVSDKVTEDVAVSELVTRLPIDNGIFEWVKCISSSELVRKDVSSKIVEAGYDAKRLAYLLTIFYTGKLEE